MLPLTNTMPGGGAAVAESCVMDDALEELLGEQARGCWTLPHHIAAASYEGGGNVKSAPASPPAPPPSDVSADSTTPPPEGALLAPDKRSANSIRGLLPPLPELRRQLPVPTQQELRRGPRQQEPMPVLPPPEMPAPGHTHVLCFAFAAVKFGRMSKKQREKVEDEVRFHRAQLRAQTETAPDSSVFDTQTPSSSDQLQPNYNGGYTYNSDLGSYTPATHGGYAYATTQVQTQHQQMPYDISADYVDSTTTYDPRPGPGLDALSADGAIMANVVTTGSAGKASSLGLLGQDQQQQHPRPGMNQRIGGGNGNGGGGSSSGGGLVTVKQEATPASTAVENLVAGFVDSTTFLAASPAPSSTQPRQQQPPGLPPSLPPPRQATEEPAEAEPGTTVHPNPAQISELLSKTIADAHARTCLFTTEHIHEMFRKPQDLSKLLYYKNMAHEELWLECAQKLTTVIQQIIEFAKMVPGFMKLSQDDQIVLLKAGSFELAVLRMSRYFDLSQNCVLYADTMLPQDAFYTTETAEMKLVTCVFEFAKGVAELKLTETELALYSACVLLSADRPGLKGLAEIGRLSQAVLRALRIELERNHAIPIKGDVTVYDALLAKVPTLRMLNAFGIKNYLVVATPPSIRTEHAPHGRTCEVQEVHPAPGVPGLAQGTLLRRQLSGAHHGCQPSSQLLDLSGM
ncbi:hypothetical protein C0J52_00728 [Blattella germanica]|nr:hypothetical protein C0J52_00728 [Blattella germanica]